MGKFNIYDTAITIPAILIAFAFHEFAHAFVADRLGDSTPRYEGRLTLNPANHIEPIGFLMIIIFGFGWAKPVRTNPSAYKDYYRDDFWISIAGPIANFLTSIFFSIILGVYLAVIQFYLSERVAFVLYHMILKGITLNVSLGFFNLLPIPGFDGFHALKDLFKGRLNEVEEKLWRFKPALLMGAVYFGGYIIAAPGNIVLNWMFGISDLVGGIFI